MLGTIYLEMPAKPNVMNNLQDEASENVLVMQE